MKRKLIVVSHDAMIYEDLEYLTKRSAFAYFSENGSLVKTLRTIYPTVTYPCHSSMITGCYPDKTGVFSNEEGTLHPVAGGTPWLWERKWNKCKTLIDAAKEAGCTTANVFWPVLGNDKNIDYNIPEYWSQSKDDNLFDAFKRMGTSDKVLEEIVKPNYKFIAGRQRQHPWADDFVMSCACDIVEKYNPDVMFVHPAGIDGARHAYGMFGKELVHNLDHTEYWMEMLIEACKRAGTLDVTDFVMMSDHGQMNISRWAHPNVLLREGGFITCNDKDEIVDIKAYAKSNGASCLIYVTDKNDSVIRKNLYNFLTEKMKTGLYGFSEIFTESEIREKERLGGNFDFCLETDGSTSFGWEHYGPYFTSYDTNDYRTGKATHGYLPDKSYQPTMIVCGPSFNKGVTIDRRPSVDFAPTIAKIYGWNLPADGCSIDELIK